MGSIDGTFELIDASLQELRLSQGNMVHTLTNDFQSMLTAAMASLNTPIVDGRATSTAPPTNRGKSVEELDDKLRLQLNKEIWKIDWGWMKFFISLLLVALALSADVWK
ncbi:hypothetical protein O6P43_026715 [Quillaja saponaria]|uniref:Uncharacterized protein n=1 Tax=Quillaja saponaria TaxID=32244 RepID=A0AAD7PCH4_QUISA|nr:hypothetical protein O6P43_026715 [Quillaja saponaria]